MIIQGCSECFNVEVGDRVQLQYNGYYEVPKWMSGDIVTVVGFTKKKIKIDHEGEIVSVRHDQLREVK